jgi:hypothetical protein
MHIEVLPRDDLTNGWTAMLPPAPPARRPKGAETADYAVIGAGFAGLAAARRLAELAPGRRIVLLEAQRVGDGSSGRNSGFIIDLPHEAESLGEDAQGLQQRTLRLNRFAIGRLRSLVKEKSIDCQWTECGMYRGAVTQRASRFLDPYERMIGRLGLSCRRLDRHELKARLGTSLYHKPCIRRARFSCSRQRWCGVSPGVCLATWSCSSNRRSCRSKRDRPSA